MAQQLNDSIFLRACRGEQTSRSPIWLMRQAGRYMPAYRALREKHTLLEIVKTPELACEVTLQPIRAFGFDAAIIFADILPLLEVLGLDIEFMAGEGPHIHNPIRSAHDVIKLENRSVEETLRFTLDAISMVRKELDPLGVPLIGFSGAPFTLASYAIEGGSSRDHRLTKQFMYQEPDAWHALMRKLAQAIGEYLVAQVRSGAHAVQIFDSWAGSLSPSDFQLYVMPYLKQVISMCRATPVPVLYFSTGTGAYLDVVRDLAVDVFSIDWRINLDAAWNLLGGEKSIQGNLDPATLFAPWPELKRQATIVLENASKVRHDRRGFIFNLGHGILPTTPEDNVKRLAEFVMKY